MKKCTCDQKNILNVSIANHEETLGGILLSLNKKKKPRDYIQWLKIPNSHPSKYERDSHHMAKLARDYHENLQMADLGLLDHNKLEMSTDMLLQEIPEGQKIANPEVLPLNWLVKETHMTKALHQTKNCSTIRMDGCPYELWKALQKRHEDMIKKNQPSFDCYEQ